MNIQQDAANRVAQEGLAYAVQDYCNPKRWDDDPELAKLWRAAAIACNELETYLAPFSEGDELTDRTGDLEALRR